jgi:hypothetical protein
VTQSVCNGHQRHWFTPYGQVGRRVDRCIRCGELRRPPSRPRKRLGKRAYRTVLWGFASIVSARSRGQAIARTLAAYRETLRTAEWKDVKCRRAPEFDGWAELDESGSPWDAAARPVDGRTGR